MKRKQASQARNDKTQFSVPWERSRSVWVCKAVLPAGGCGAVSWRQVVKETENTHGKGTGRSSRELTYNKELTCYIQGCK